MTSALQEIKIQADEAEWIAKAMLAATVAKPAETRHHIHWRVLGDGELVVTAADGFRVHQTRMHLFEAPDPCAFTMPVAALRWLQKAAKEFKANRDAMLSPKVIVEALLPDGDPDPLNPGELRIIVREWDAPGAPQTRFDCALVPGEYPPYWDTINALYDAPVGEPSRVPLGYLGAAAALHTVGTETPIIRYTQTPSGGDGMAVLSFWAAGTLRAEAALQPKTEEQDA